MLAVIIWFTLFIFYLTSMLQLTWYMFILSVIYLIYVYVTCYSIPGDIIKDVLSTTSRITFYSFLTTLAKSTAVNQHIGEHSTCIIPTQSIHFQTKIHLIFLFSEHMFHLSAVEIELLAKLFTFSVCSFASYCSCKLHSIQTLNWETVTVVASINFDSAAKAQVIEDQADSLH